MISGAVDKIKCASISFKNMSSALDDETVEFGGRNPLCKGCTQPMQKIKNPLLLLMDLRRAFSELTNASVGAKNDKTKHPHDKGHEGDDKSLNRLKHHEKASP